MYGNGNHRRPACRVGSQPRVNTIIQNKGQKEKPSSVLLRLSDPGGIPSLSEMQAVIFAHTKSLEMSFGNYEISSSGFRIQFKKCWSFFFFDIRHGLQVDTTVSANKKILLALPKYVSAGYKMCA